MSRGGCDAISLYESRDMNLPAGQLRYCNSALSFGLNFQLALSLRFRKLRAYSCTRKEKKYKKKIPERVDAENARLHTY